MNRLSIELNDLPDEILLMVFKKLNNLEVLYSFHGVNKRLNKIINDPIFTSRLSFLKRPSNIILDRFRLQILPEISMNIKWLDLESSSMKYILHVTDFSNLYGIGLHDIDEEKAICLFTDKKLSSGIFKNQITTLVIGIDSNVDDWSAMEKICNHIFTVFINLTHLIFYDNTYKITGRLLFDFPSPSFSSSSLLVLKIKVQSFCVCLYILDGRFNQLHTLQIDLTNINPPSEEIENQKKLPNLKHFVLSCTLETMSYGQLILPLLYRMSNLEKLGLYIAVYVEGTFIDGNHLKQNILNHMPLINQFTFDIRSWMFYNEMNLPSKEDIQETFKDFQYSEIISCVDYFLEQKRSQCHVYSYPFLMQSYEFVTNNFPGGLYQYVRVVLLYDEHPFEHEFFVRISQSFPFMQQLSVMNRHAQNEKQSDKPINDNHNLSIVKYCHLHRLNFQRVHDDYIEEFLLNTKTYLHNNILLSIDYESLERVTLNFTRDDTRINCVKVFEMYLYGKGEDLKSLRDYFPFAIIH